MTPPRDADESAPLYGREPHGNLPSRDRSRYRTRSDHRNREGP
jgi:hypothetical protein